MHDLAKCFEPQRLLHMAPEEGLVLDQFFSPSPHLLHADVSAIVTRDTFGVREPQVLNPIAHRTLSKPSMSKLSHLLFLADTLEPEKHKTASLQALRQVSRENIHPALYLIYNYTLKKNGQSFLDLFATNPYSK